MELIPKFRAWLPTLKWMCEVTVIDYDLRSVDICRIEDVARHTEMRVDKDEVVLMQSTGLKDKNDTEIFEGDVAVMDGWRRQVVTFGTQEVEEEFGSVRIYRGFNLYLGGGYPNAVMSEFEVVGNIYENPELMEEKNERR
ncbi:YopX family protein [Streptococcus anginosus]|uniref:YopX family protein n=1 Tax=Streptococcus anginosus TaxID=1328 RepID=UPI0020013B6C|nr:YopX family protein [Streptococcus anginosus]